MPLTAEWPALRDIIARFDLKADKSLGQHFLLDGNLLDKIRRCAEPLAGLNVIEIGPGPGGLTRALLASDAAQVTALELDPRAVAATQALAAYCPARLSVVAGDALAADLPALVPAPRAIVANLPYNVGTPATAALAAPGRGIPGNDLDVSAGSGAAYRGGPRTATPMGGYR